MNKFYEVQWFKECYPLPDESGKKTFTSRREAVLFGRKMFDAGYQIWQLEKCYDLDDEN